MTGHCVELTWGEWRQACHVGADRRIKARYKGVRDAAGDGDRWGLDIEGAAAEMAFAKLRGTYWSYQTGVCYDGDVGPYEIRSTARTDGHLILREHDRDAVFVLAIGVGRRWRFPGWTTAGDGKQPHYLSNGDPLRPPCWMVPQSALHPIGELP